MQEFYLGMSLLAISYGARFSVAEWMDRV